LTAQQNAAFEKLAYGGGSSSTGGEVLIKFQNGSLEGYMNYRNKKINNTR